MGTISTRVIDVLSPYIGDTVADTCVRATALSLGKTADEITAEDMPALETSVRRLLGPVAPSNVVEELIEQIKEGVA